jgi:LysM repeat protein/uncharacterized protein involved in exopolysaccharide biosynthesis
MDIIQIIKLFRRSLLLLIAIPIIFAGVTYYFTRNQEKVFQSEAVIYTGITTGYSIESTSQRTNDFFTTSAQFDNMINLLKSRQTLIETSLQLLTQDLSLEQYNAQYISQINYSRLQAATPKRIKDLVVKNNKSGIERKKEEQINTLEKEIRSLEREINKKKNRAAQNKTISNKTSISTNNISRGVEKESMGVTPDFDNENDYLTSHVVQQGESLSLLSSRYGVSLGEIMSLNNLSSNSLTPGQSLIIKKKPITDRKYHTVKPGETLYSIAKKYGVNISKLREINGIDNRSLLPGQKILVTENKAASKSAYSYDYAMKQISDDVIEENQPYNNHQVQSDINEYTSKIHESSDFAKDPIIPPGIRTSDFKKTLSNMSRSYTSNDTNYIYGLLHYGESKHYSVKSIGRIEIYRINNSDLVRLTYTSDDPGICQQTLKILSKVFMKNYKLLRSSETSLVVKYFEDQVDSADKKLQKAEDRLLQFNMKNNIINYYEQSKAIAGQKEDLDLFYQNEQIRLASSVATLRELELNLTSKDSIYLKSDEINQMKKELSQVTESIVVNELASDYDERVVEQLDILKKRRQELRNDIKFYVDQLYLYSHSTQGLPISTLLDQWLINTINMEEAKASLIVLARRKLDFVRTYQRFAPLGAMLKRIEREIKVAEQSYLELLRSLNLAKMKQQNEEMSTNIKMVDEPYFPITSNPSRAKLVILVAALFGFFLTAFIILMLEYFDTSMKNPSRVSKATKMKLAGAFPRLSSRSKANELAFVSQRLIDIIIQNIKLSLNKDVNKTDNSPYIISIFSTQESVGKTIIANRIIKRLREVGDTVLSLNYNSKNNVDDDFNYSYTYEITDNFIDIENLQQLISSKYLRKSNKNYDFIFIELPSLVYNTYPIKLIGNVDLSLYVINATNKLTKADKTALDTYNQITSNNSMVLLNEVELFNLDELLSDVPSITKPDRVGKIKRMLARPFKYRLNIKRKA